MSDRAKEYASMFYRHCTYGDTYFMDIFWEMLRDDGFVDENDEWIYNEDD